MKDRIKQLMESMNMTQQEFAKFLGQSTATICAVFTGRTAPSMRLVEAIKKHVPNISYDWLLDGVGSMYVDQNRQISGSEGVAADKSKAINKMEKEAAATSPSTPSMSSRGGQENVKKTVDMKISDNVHRKITEIKVYYDDNYCETFILKENK